MSLGYLAKCEKVKVRMERRREGKKRRRRNGRRIKEVEKDEESKWKNEEIGKGE